MRIDLDNEYVLSSTQRSLSIGDCPRIINHSKEWEPAKTEMGPGTFPKSPFLRANLLPVHLQQLYDASF